MFPSILTVLACSALVSQSPYAKAFSPTFLSSESSVRGSNSLLKHNVFSRNVMSPRGKISSMKLWNSLDDDEEEDDDGDDDDEPSVYEQFAQSEFFSDDNKSSSSLAPFTPATTQVDWGGEYETLKQRLDDSEFGSKAIPPSRALFRVMTSESPNEAILKFVNGASPEVVTAMSSAVTSLLGGLSTGAAAPGPGLVRGGIETIIRTNGEQLGSLCFQLQMTGYMFRNAEYVIAIREIMKLPSITKQPSLKEYKRAFDRMDTDGSGYIEREEVEALLRKVYATDFESKDSVPAYEVKAFVDFFDRNKDGKISWAEFEYGLGIVGQTKKDDGMKALSGSGEFDVDDFDEDEDFDDEDDYINDSIFSEPKVSGKIEIEMINGNVIEVEANEYIAELKREAALLKKALAEEQMGGMASSDFGLPVPMDSTNITTQQQQPKESIAGYIASLQGDIDALTKNISPEVVDAMKMLVDYVLEPSTSQRGTGSNRKTAEELRQVEMELPSSALQQLALWQLVLGYKLREEEATGNYRKMLE